jgi:cytochrome P450
MTTSTTTDLAHAGAPDFPGARSCPFAPSPVYTEARESGAPRRVRLWDGSEPWLISRHDQIREMLGDARFGADVTDPAFPNTNATQPDVEGGLFFRHDGDYHLRVRRMLNPDFTAKRAESWRPRVAEITESTIDRLETLERPLDLVREFALDVPTTVICEVLGVPVEESWEVTGCMDALVSLVAPHDEKMAGYRRINELLVRHAEDKRVHPDDRLLSRLVNTHVANGDISFDEAIGLANTVIGAGHETTSNMLGLGALALIRQPDQARALVADPETGARTCAEEMLRWWSIVQTEPRRFALEDVEIGGVTIREGEGVVCSLAAANRDPLVFSGDPEALDITRTERRHIAFGHGIHQCLGQNLARVEMQEAWPRLFRRLPDLRLAVDESELRFHDTHLTYGLDTLPVTW